MGFPNTPSLQSLRPGVALLSATVAAALNDPENFIAARIVPPIPAEKGALAEGRIVTAGIGSYFGNGSNNLAWAPGANIPSASGSSNSFVSYIAERFGLEDFLDKIEIDDAQFAIEEQKLGTLAHSLAIAREVRTYNAAMNAVTFSTNSFVADTLWDEVAAKPFSDIRRACRLVNRFGRKVNTVAMSRAAAEAMATNDSVLSFLPTTVNRNDFSDEELVRAIASYNKVPVERVFIFDTVQNTAADGIAPVLSEIGGTDRRVFVGHIAMDREIQQTAVFGERVQTIGSALTRVEAEAPTADYEDAKRPKSGRFVFAHHREALVPVLQQLGCVITC